MAFNHEKLKVYQRTLSFNVKVSSWTGEWDHRHAIRDHLHRAAESMLENIAMASAAYSEIKIRSLDFAIGSSLECAACLDLARLKRLLDAERVYAEKEELSQILRMLVGLRTSWARMPQMVREDADEYRVANAGVDEAADKTHENESKETVLFHHETLDVYRLATQAVAAVCSSEEVPRLSNSVFRRLDELLTSMVLNIAEGNGRFSGDDQARFLGTSHEASIKLAARLDLCVAQELLPREEVVGWKELLERVSFMTSAMIDSVGGRDNRQSSRQSLRQSLRQREGEDLT